MRRLIVLLLLLVVGCVARTAHDLSTDAVDLLREIDERGMLWHTWSSYELLDNRVTWRDTGQQLSRENRMVGQRELWRRINGTSRLTLIESDYLILVSIGCTYEHCVYDVRLTDNARSIVYD